MFCFSLSSFFFFISLPLKPGSMRYSFFFLYNLAAQAGDLRYSLFILLGRLFYLSYSTSPQNHDKTSTSKHVLLIPDQYQRDHEDDSQKHGQTTRIGTCSQNGRLPGDSKEVGWKVCTVALRPTNRMKSSGVKHGGVDHDREPQPTSSMERFLLGHRLNLNRKQWKVCSERTSPYQIS